MKLQIGCTNTLLQATLDSRETKIDISLESSTIFQLAIFRTKQIRLSTTMYSTGLFKIVLGIK